MSALPCFIISDFTIIRFILLSPLYGRALALAVAMMVYGKEESADTLIEQLSKDRGEHY